ncbi:MAG TPA: phage holin family protein [Pseudolysinimonas sp.]|jgi:putative membrane protein
MGRLLLRLLINAVALWLTTLILGGQGDDGQPHLAIVPYASGTVAFILTLLLVAAIFGIVNAIVGTIVRIVALPLYILTLGLISLIVNGLLLLLAAWITGLFGFGLHVENFGWGILGALILGILAWLIGLILRPFTGPRRS